MNIKAENVSFTIFSSNSILVLEDRLNEYIDKNPDYILVDIKFTSDDLGFTVLLTMNVESLWTKQ